MARKRLELRQTTRVTGVALITKGQFNRLAGGLLDALCQRCALTRSRSLAGVTSKVIPQGIHSYMHFGPLRNNGAGNNDKL